MQKKLLVPIGAFAVAMAFNSSAQVFNDFEGATIGSQWGFVQPSFSGSTGASIATAPAPDLHDVVAGHDGNTTQVGRFDFEFVDNSATRWVRLTTFNAPGVPNPALDLTQMLQFEIWTLNPIEVAVGVRETGGSGPVGANAGSSGTVEWVGASQASSSISVPPGGKSVAAGSWQTLTFSFQQDPAFAFTGDGNLTGTWGALESLAVSGLGNQVHTIYVDNFRIVPVPEPSTIALGILGGSGLLVGYLRRRKTK